MVKYGENIDRLCATLQTKPVTSCKVLVTGASGYIGSELIPELLARGYSVRIMLRSSIAEYQKLWPEVEIVQADALNYDDLIRALDGIYCAYYLIHSLHLGNEKFIEIDQQIAVNFRKAAEENQLKRIIYLGGLGNRDANLSDHLLSRFMVAEELQKGKTPVTFLKAGVIVGPGSASYRIIKHLIENCPLFLFPRKSNSRCQPIGVGDVIRYLVGSLETPETTGKAYDIGGQNVLTYKKMLQVVAAIKGVKRIFVSTSLVTIKLCAWITSKLTPEPYLLVRSLMESCTYDAVCQSDTIEKIIPFETSTYKDALLIALRMESQKDKKITKQKLFYRKESLIKKLAPPNRSKWILTDIYYFFLKRPKIQTRIKFRNQSERENFSYRILQRLDIGVTEYRILNIHKIGVNVPAKYIFEELLKWNGDSTCWPNHIANVVRIHDQLEHLDIYLFGWTKFPALIRKILRRLKLIPMFKLNILKFQKVPNVMADDNARYLLYSCSGGYPIGVFTMYVRSSIEQQNEKELSQLFLMVGFNFYGKENLSKLKFVNKIWEFIHNRVTSHVLNRIKQLSEWRFNKIQVG